MKITPKTNIQQSQVKIVDKIRTMFFKGKVKLKTLLCDVFEKNPPKRLSEEEIAQYDEYLKKVLPKDAFDPNVKREYTPPWITKDEEIKDLVWGRLKFYPEDQNKIDSLSTIEEKIAYEDILKKQGRYYYVEGDG